MHSYEVMTQNWLTRKPQFQGFLTTSILTLLNLVFSFFDWSQINSVFKANADLVLSQHHFLNLWTSLFVHADFSHLMSNLLLFIPLVYLISSYYGAVILPALAILMGGLINWIVLHTLGSEVYLIGISGVVDWLGAVWLVLFYLIDLRENRRRRFAVVLFISFILFVPETYKPEVSYLSHFVGYVLGVITAVVYYLIYRNQFKKAEHFEKIDEVDTASLFETDFSSQNHMSNLS